MDTQACAACGLAKPLDQFDPRFIHKGTRLTCATCRHEGTAKEREAWQQERAAQEAEAAAERAWWQADGFLRHAQAPGRLRADAPSSIYALAEPRTQRIYYVGRTQDLAKRLQGHIAAALHPPRHPVASMAATRALLDAGTRPAMRVLETTYPCCTLYPRSLPPWETEESDALRAYDLYVSEREVRWTLWAYASGHPVQNRYGVVPVAQIVAGVELAGVDFLTVARTHPVWHALGEARYAYLRYLRAHPSRPRR